MAVSQRATLAPRERQIIALVAEGLTTQQIARRLEISPHTVGMGIRRVMLHLHARSRAHAVALAYQQGILRADD